MMGTIIAPTGCQVVYMFGLIFFPQLMLKIFKHIEKLQKYYSEHSYTLHLDLFALPFYAHTHAHILTHTLFFSKPFESELQTPQHFTSKHGSMYV